MRKKKHFLGRGGIVGFVVFRFFLFFDKLFFALIFLLFFLVFLVAKPVECRMLLIMCSNSYLLYKKCGPSECVVFEAKTGVLSCLVFKIGHQMIGLSIAKGKVSRGPFV